MFDADEDFEMMSLPDHYSFSQSDLEFFAEENSMTII